MLCLLLTVHICKEQSNLQKLVNQSKHWNVNQAEAAFRLLQINSNIQSISSDSHCLMKNILSRLFANIGKQIQKDHSSSCKEYNSGTHLIARCLGCGDKYRTFETVKQTNLLQMNLSNIFEVCCYPLCLKANICLDLGSSFKPLKKLFQS